MATELTTKESSPAEPLRDARYERFVQLRAIGVPCQAAAWEAGFRAKGNQQLRSGNAARLDRREDVRARRAFLTAADAEVVIATRAFVRDRLMRWATLDILSKYAIVENAKVGEREIPRIIGIDWMALKESEHASAIVGFKFDRETGMLTDFTTIRPDDAVDQLIKLDGLAVPEKRDVTVRGADQFTDDELARIAAGGGEGAAAVP